MGKYINFTSPVKKPEKLINFYKNVFNWDIQQSSDTENLWKIQMEENPFCHNEFSDFLNQNGVRSIVSIIDVPDLDHSIESIKQNEGKILIDKLEIPHVGKMAYAKDCEGTVFGLIEKNK